LPFPHFNPVLVSIGPIAIRWYALAYVAGILIGWRYIAGLLKRPALFERRGPAATTLQLDDLILWITLGVIVGGRLGHVFFYTPGIVLSDPLEVFKTWHGGMSFHGDMLGVIVAVLAFCRVNKLDALRVGDLIAAAAPIGLFFGRLANFINGELWGRPTSLPWGVIFPDADGQPRHPSQIYEALLEGVVLFLVLRTATHAGKWLNRRGAVVGLFLLGYGFARTAVENVREPDAYMPHFPFGLTMGMMLSSPMWIGGLILLWRGLAEPLPATPPSEAAASGATVRDPS